VSAQILGFASYYFAQPFTYFWTIYFIIVNPTFFARVVGRINVNALHLSRVVGEQGFEGEQVIALHEQVAALTPVPSPGGRGGTDNLSLHFSK